MKRFLLLTLISFLMATSLTGCGVAESAGDTVETVFSEIGEAYDNVVDKITSVKDWIDNKVNKVEQAAEDVQEAADSVSEAIDSVKSLTGDEEIGEEVTE